MWFLISDYENRVDELHLETVYSLEEIRAHMFFVEWLVLKSLSSCFKLWISFKMQIKLLLGGAEEESRGLRLTSLLTKEAVSCILHGF